MTPVNVLVHVGRARARARARSVLGLGLGLALAGCGFGHTPVTDPAESASSAPTQADASPAVKATADAIAHAYELLAIHSAAPGNRPKMAAAVLDALAPEGWHPPMINWSEDPAQDAQTLRALVLGMSKSGALPADAVLRAAHGMAAASGDLNTFALGRAAVTALFAQLAGTANVQPGMTYNRSPDGRWVASSVIAKGAAGQAGVHRGDVLVSIDGRKVEHGYIDFAPLLGAPAGTAASLVIDRAGKTAEIGLRLGVVDPPIVESKMLAGGIGYIRVWSCTHADAKARDAGALVAKALGQLDANHARALVLDLRGNPGGFPFDIASLLVDADPLLVSVSATGEEQPLERTKLAAWKTKRPIAVLVDDETASGAEMLALALRDTGATIVGRPTAGALTLTTVETIAGDVTLSYPVSRIASAKTKTPIDGNRLVPDFDVANPTAADYAAGRDPQLDSAIAALAGAH